MFLSRLIPVLFSALLAFGVTSQSELTATFQPAPRPLPTSVHFKSGLRLDVYFPSLIQGGSGLLRLSGGDIVAARLSFRGVEQPFFTLDDADWYGLIVVDMDAFPRSYLLTVIAERSADAVSFTHDLRIDSAAYIVQRLDLPADRAYLAGAAVEQAEFALLAEITADRGPEPLWDESGFELPHDSELTSPYGAYRVFNGERETRHTGWDQNAPAGTPIRALAAGAVVFAAPLEIRGNTVIIDHGLGIYSGYAHLSDLQVEVGQRIAAGQIIGSSGDSGRSSGAHLHWEIIAQGEWIDGLTFINLWLPASSR